MFLKTQQEIREVLPLIESTLGVTSHSLSNSPINMVNYVYKNKRINASTFIPSPSLKNNAVLNMKANVKRTDLIIDLFYHWLTDFSELTTKGQIKEALQYPATAASFATTIAVNRYITRNNLTKNQITDLFSGCPWRWKNMTSTTNVNYSISPYYIQSRFYLNSPPQNNRIYGFQENNLAYSILHNNVTFIQHLEKIKTNIDYNIANPPIELLGASYRATEYFKFKKKSKAIHNTFLGIELELENFYPNETRTLNTLKTHAIFKRDGSLRNGVEICTAPATLDIHKEAFSSFFDAMVKNGSALEAQSTCGLHIHVDKRKMSLLHLANICNFINFENNRNFLNELAGREPNRYCNIKQRNYQDFISEDRMHSKYELINISPPTTIEFRLFASTTNQKVFNTRLEFVQCIVDYTKPGVTNHSPRNLIYWNNFTSFVASQKKLYPNLAVYLFGERIRNNATNNLSV